MCYLRRLGEEPLSAIAREQDWTAYHTPESVRREELPEGYVERSRLLDKPSDAHPILSALMDETLLRIMLVSDGAVMALRERTTGSKAGTMTPSSELATIVNELDQRFERCKTHRARLTVIKQAQSIGVRLRYAPDRSLIRDTEEWREAVAADSRSCRDLAEIWGVSHMTIARIKKQAAKAAKIKPGPTIVQRGKKHSVKEREAINKKRTKASEAVTQLAQAVIVT